MCSLTRTGESKRKDDEKYKYSLGRVTRVPNYPCRISQNNSNSYCKLICWLIIDESLYTQNLFWYRVWRFFVVVVRENKTFDDLMSWGEGLWKFSIHYKYFSHGAIARCFRESANGARHYVVDMLKRLAPRSVRPACMTYSLLVEPWKK